ncbi:MAG: hypothetical protein LBE01_03035 [Deltaproteobacteria bacterium]|jgi:hypothetical protein|nr:hypothetical protein [Deltaproteobacteria bacterium]
MKVYKPSGFFDTKGLIFTPFIVAIVSMFLAVYYARALWFCPIVYLGAALPVLYAMAVGYASRWSVRKSNIRSPQLAKVLGTIGAIPGFYVSWAAWGGLTNNVTGQGTLNLGFKKFPIVDSFVSLSQALSQALHPFQLVQKVQEIAGVGLWSVEGFVVHGVFLYGVWILEAAIFFFFVGRRFSPIGAAPFSERKFQWYPETKLTVPIALPTNVAGVEAFEAIEKGQVGALVNAREERSPESASYLKVVLYYLEGAGDAYATIYGYALTRGSSHKKKLLVKYVKVPEALGKTLSNKF